MPASLYNGLITTGGKIFEPAYKASHFQNPKFLSCSHLTADVLLRQDILIKLGHLPHLFIPNNSLESQEGLSIYSRTEISLK